MGGEIEEEIVRAGAGAGACVGDAEAGQGGGGGGGGSRDGEVQEVAEGLSLEVVLRVESH